MKTVQISLNSIDKVKSFVNEITKFDYDFDPENITPGQYQVTFKTTGYEYKVHTTDYAEVDSMVGLSFDPEDIHIMSKETFS